MSCYVCEDSPEKLPFCPRCGHHRFQEREQEERYQTDRYYKLACEYAKNEYVFLGIMRTDEEINQETEKLRQLIPPK